MEPVTKAAEQVWLVTVPYLEETGANDNYKMDFSLHQEEDYNWETRVLIAE